MHSKTFRDISFFIQTTFYLSHSNKFTLLYISNSDYTHIQFIFYSNTSLQNYYNTLQSQVPRENSFYGSLKLPSHSAWGCPAVPRVSSWPADYTCFTNKPPLSTIHLQNQRQTNLLTNKSQQHINSSWIQPQKANNHY